MPLQESTPFVIGISGISGAGKSVITSTLSEKLHATALYWDDYDEISEAPSDLIQWFEQGQDYKAWKYDALVSVLQNLKEGKKVVCPLKKKELLPTKFIIFDAPLGKKHASTGQFIDLQFHIDTPLDIALSRRLIRDFKENEKSKKEIIEELEFYLEHSRKLFFMTDVKAVADVSIDGALPLYTQVNLIIEHIKRS